MNNLEERITPAMMLSIAGSDSSAGAGIQADIKAAAECGTYCTTAITALTAQNTLGVNDVETVSPSMVEAQIRAVLDDMPVRAIKSGMIPTSEIIESVADTICIYRDKIGIPKKENGDDARLNYVLDPVMISTSGHKLIDDVAVDTLVSRLIPLSLVVTPNIPEAERISGVTISSVDDYSLVASRFKDLGARYLLVKGGHLVGGDVVDVLFDLHGGERYEERSSRIDTLNTHGTGCSLSSSIAAYLAQGMTLEDSFRGAVVFMRRALLSGSRYCYGASSGGVLHLRAGFAASSQR